MAKATIADIRKVAVKIVDDWEIESLKVVGLE
jgi:hypothetical protein